MAFSECEGEFAFCVVAVPEGDRHPVVDHRDRGQIDRNHVAVVGLGVELGEVLGEPPGPPLVADRAEGGRVAVVSSPR